ncbi:MAG: dihydrolipoyllysine-residue acetyltransferase [Methylococcaceae bacterium]
MGLEQEVLVPDIGDFKSVEIIEVLVSPGQVIRPEESLITLESDKAAMEVPSSHGGIIKTVLVKVGDKVSRGTPILILSEAAAQASAPSAPAPVVAQPAEPEPVAPRAATPVATPAPAVPATVFSPPPVAESGLRVPHASPSVRRFARELGADIAKISGTGPKGRILRPDVHAYIKQVLKQAEQQPAGGGAFLSLPKAPDIDFSRFGPTETLSLSRIKKLSGANLHRSWISSPHVTQFDQADISGLEAFRATLKAESEKRGIKLTILPFVIKALVAALKAYPHFNASLDSSGESLILKQYYHFGIAVDTADGLVVPVLRDVDQKGLFDLSAELAELGHKARGKKLRGSDLEGGTFTVSSLGGIGGTAFTPIINPPEVAILGLSRTQTQPVWQEGQFVPRLMLPLSLSYDHRVIDGAEGARFITYLSGLLADLRRVLL